jgi:hypothetical protein
MLLIDCATGGIHTAQAAKSRSRLSVAIATPNQSSCSGCLVDRDAARTGATMNEARDRKKDASIVI